MRLLFTGYVNSPEYNDPDEWLHRIEAYTGILTTLAKTNEVLAIEHISFEGKLTKNNVSYQFVNLGKNFHHRPAKFHKLIRDEKPDVVFINGFNFPLQIILLGLALGNKVKLMILHRAEKPFPGFKKWFQKIADRFVSAYLFSSKEFAESWKDNLDPKKIHQVIQASSVFRPEDKTQARRNLGLELNNLILLFVGNLIPGKDPLTIIEAFATFCEIHQRAKLYMIFQSDTLLPEVSSLIETKGVGNNIILVGKIPHKNMGDWYNAGDFIISGSHYEGNGISVAEAMSSGCIPIVSNITSFRGMTGGSKCGFLFEPGNSDDLLEKLMAIPDIDYDTERSRVLHQFQSELSFEAIAKKINCITESIIHDQFSAQPG